MDLTMASLVKEKSRYGFVSHTVCREAVFIENFLCTRHLTYFNSTSQALGRYCGHVCFAVKEAERS